MGVGAHGAQAEKRKGVLMTVGFPWAKPFWLVLVATGFIASGSNGKAGQTMTAPTTPSRASLRRVENGARRRSYAASQ
jgi:hypothetical protein